MNKLKKILIKTKRQIFSEIPGNNPSVFEGEGYDFVELREYQYGDDVRKIDWNITAKMQKPYIKVFKEERELNIVIVSLLNGSVHFGQKKLKQEQIAEIASLLAFSAVKNSDVFSSYIYTDKVESFTKPTKNIHSVEKSVNKILYFESLSKILDLQNFTKILFERVKRKSLVFIIGDFFGEFDFSVLAKKHEVIALIVRDKLEEEPPDFGHINLVDPQSMGISTLDIDKTAILNYKRKVHDNDHELYTHFKKNAIAFTKIYTDEDPFVKLSKLFIKR